MEINNFIKNIPKEILIKNSLKYLEKDIHKNCDLISFIKFYDNNIEFIYVEDNGVCIYINNKDIYGVSSDSKEISKKICKLIKCCNNCSCKTKWDYEIFNEKFKFKGVDVCKQYIFNKNKNYIHNKNIIKLKEEHIPFIINNYTQPISKDELIFLMNKFTFYGYINDEGNLTAFVGRHADAEIGFLHVLNNYRLKGYGSQLIHEIINEDSNIIPYSQVEKDNVGSITFHEKIGSISYNNYVYWCYNENM